MPDTVTLDIEVCFDCGEWNRTFRSGPAAFCKRCGGKIAHRVFDVDRPKLDPKK